MLAKSLLAGVVMSVLAGGVVYFGLGGELSDKAKINKVVETVSDVEDKVMAGAKAGAEKVSDAAKDVGESSREKLNALMGKEPKVSFKTKEADEGETNIKAEAAEVQPKTAAGMNVGEAKDEKSDPPKKRWLDEYLKSDKPEEADNTETDDASEVEDIAPKSPEEAIKTKDKPKSDLRSYIEKEREKMRTTIEKLDEMPKADPMPEEALSKDAVTLIKPEATGTYKIKVLDEAMDKPSPPKMGHGELFDLLMTETDKLDIPDMRDQAYLNIVDFALAKGDRSIAEEVLAKLSREELRDTARGRVAVALAKAGESEAAFDVIDTLEIEELQGPIRLQVIEALTIGKIPVN